MNTGSAIVSIERELAAIVGPEHLHERAVELTHHAIDSVVPEYIVEPADDAEVLALVQLANSRKLTVTVAGGFTAQETGRTPARVDIVLKTTRLNRIEHYDPGDLTIAVGAGATVQSVREAVGRHHQLLPIEVASSASTIGGAVARAAHGPLRHAYGGLRDLCVGLRFVTGDGRLAKSGGRVVKNVAGYDVTKLLVGSYGTLAIVTSANFRVSPEPRQTRTFVADFSSAHDALAFRDLVQRSPLTPMCLDMASPLAQEFFASHSDHATWRVMVRARGSDAILDRYVRDLGSAVTHVFDHSAELNYWNSITEFPDRVCSLHQNAMTVSLSVAPSELEAALHFAEQAAAENNLLLAVSGRCAIASVKLAFIPIPQGAPVVTQYARCIEQLRSRLARDASCLITRCPHQVKEHVDVWGIPATDLDAIRAVKLALDQHDVLNRGRFLL